MFAYVREGGRRNFLKAYIHFYQNEPQLFCLIGDLPASHKSLFLNLEKSGIVNSEILLLRPLYNNSQSVELAEILTFYKSEVLHRN